MAIFYITPRGALTEVVSGSDATLEVKEDFVEVDQRMKAEKDIRGAIE